MDKVLRLPFGMLLFSISEGGELLSITNQATRRKLSISPKRGISVSSAMFSGRYDEGRSVAIGYGSLMELIEGKTIRKIYQDDAMSLKLEEVVPDERTYILLAGRKYQVTHTAGRPTRLMDEDGKKYKPYRRGSRETFELPYGDKKEFDYLYIRHLSSFNITNIIMGMVTWTTIEGFTYINHKLFVD